MAEEELDDELLCEERLLLDEEELLLSELRLLDELLLLLDEGDEPPLAELVPLAELFPLSELLEDDSDDALLTELLLLDELLLDKGLPLEDELLLLADGADPLLAELLDEELLEEDDIHRLPSARNRAPKEDYPANHPLRAAPLAASVILGAAPITRQPNSPKANPEFPKSYASGCPFA